MSYSRTNAAAVSSCVDSGLDAQSDSWAPPALSVSMRTAVSVVTCRQAPRRMPLSGCSRVKRSRTCRRTGIDCSAHWILSRPSGASERFLTSCSTMECRPCLVARRGRGRYRCAELDARVVPQILDAVRPLPRELGLGASEVAVGGGLLVDRPAQIEILDDPGGREIAMTPGHRLAPPVPDLAGSKRIG